MRRFVLALGLMTSASLVSLCAGSTAQAQAASPSAARAFDVPSQPLGAALNAYAMQSGQQVIFDPETVRGRRSSALVGPHTPEEGLRLLLAGSGAAFSRDEHGTYVVKPAAPKPAAPAVRAAPAAAGPESLVSPVTTSEVIVTAEKKEERLRDVPISVTAVQAARLVETNRPDLKDYFSSVPGLNLALDNRGSPAVAIRGLTTTIYGNPTVATVIDDVPYSATTATAFAWAATEFDPNELSRIEVLRGPQGVLYGAASIGGLVKYVTIKPSMDGFSGRLQASADGVANGNGAGGGLSGAVNVPLSDQAAVRVSAFGRHDPGYIDNLLTGQSGVNADDVAGARASALWRPMEGASVELSALLQRSRTYGSPNVEVNLGRLKQSYARDTGGYDRKIQAYDATLELPLGPVHLTSISGYADSSSAGSFEVSNLSYTTANSTAFFGVPFTAWVENNRTRKFSQEVRLAGAIDGVFDWVVGGFYTDEKTHLNGGFYAFQGLTGQNLGHWFSSVGPATYEEKAAFANATYHVTDRFEVQFGARYSENDQHYQKTTSFGLGPSTGEVERRSSENATTYLVAPTLHLTPDVMIYARFASGFRPGGINTEVLFGSGYPLTFGPDTTQSYEFGAKGSAFSDLLTFDAAIYRIDWRNIQVGLADFTTGASWTANFGQARSEGFEVTLEARPTRLLTLTGNLSLTNARLTEDFPANSTAQAAAGDRLPYSPKVAGSLGAEQRFPISDRLDGFAGAVVTYVGGREGEFGLGRQRYPAYGTLDLRAGATRDAWRVTVYLNNVADTRGQLAGGVGTLNPFAFTYIQPRTFGVTLARTF